MRYHQPMVDVIKQRYSCRTYREEPIEAALQQQLQEHAAALDLGPLGTAARFQLVAAGEADREALRGLGTYGFIQGATGFLLGAAGPGPKNLEDFGYLMEDLVLRATDLGLGTCWLGGTCTKSSFAARMALREDEVMPCVISVGYPSKKQGFVQRLVRLSAGSHGRLPWERLFFDGDFSRPLSREKAGVYAEALEMVRLGPSASNKQPWRVVRFDGAWHFFLRRTPGYLQGLGGMFVVADLQRVDLGIALSHFSFTAEEQGLAGAWVVEEPDLDARDDGTEYIVSWVETQRPR